MQRPSLDEWIREESRKEQADKCGMYLSHVGVVRSTPRALVRDKVMDAGTVAGMLFEYDPVKTDEAIRKTLQKDGIYSVRVWLNRGELKTGDAIMQVLVGGDIRDHVLEALTELVGELKRECVKETEIHAC